MQKIRKKLMIRFWGKLQTDEGDYIEPQSAKAGDQKSNKHKK